MTAIRKNVFIRNNREREERARRKRETELISVRFPEVKDIVVTMNYRDQKVSPMRRTLNFHPGSHAFFSLSCLGEGCVGGGLDMNRIITGSIRKHEEVAQGRIKCANMDPTANHAEMSYKVSIKYE